jgi:hypothetical protein
MISIAINSPVLFYKGNRINQSGKMPANIQMPVNIQRRHFFLLIQTVQNSEEVLMKQVCFIESPDQHDNAVDQSRVLTLLTLGRTVAYRKTAGIPAHLYTAFSGSCQDMKRQQDYRTRLTKLLFSPANVPVKVGASSSPRNVEEEEQILEAQLVPILLPPSRGIRPAPDDPLAVPVPVVGADEWKQRH